MPTASEQDPLNVLTNPPATIVKIQGTSRNDLNGQFGVALQFSVERGRYVIHLVNQVATNNTTTTTTTTTTVSLKPINIIKANMLESYLAQFQLIRKDPRVRQEISRYYNMIQTKLGFKPEYAIGIAALLFLGLIYLLGFSKTLMVLSMIMMIVLLVGQDLFVPAPSFQRIRQNFPRRCREAIEQSAPFVRGRLSDRMAAAIVLALLALAAATLVPSSKSTSLITSDSLAGTIVDEDEGPPRDLSGYDIYSARPPPPTSKSRFGLTQLMSAFLVYRTAMELGNDATGFSMQRAIANFKQMDVLRMGLLAFSVYNLIKPFLQ